MERAGFSPSRRPVDLILTIDTYAWIEIVRDSPKGRAASESMKSAEQCYTPSVVLVEFASWCLRDGLSDELIVAEILAMGEASEVVPIDSSIALGAAHATSELRENARARRTSLPGLGDGIVLATARRKGAAVLTGDPHFQGLPETVWIG